MVGDDEPLAHHVPKPSHYPWGQANWQEYCRLVSEDCKRFPTKGTPNQQAKFLSRNIAKATAKAVPKGVTRVRHLWSADLEDAERKCKKLLSPIDGTTPSQRREELCERNPHLLRTHNFDRRLPKRHRSSDYEESVEHMLFHCPRFAALRMKHGIRPPGDAKQWLERRVPDFLREALRLFDDE